MREPESYQLQVAQVRSLTTEDLACTSKQHVGSNVDPEAHILV